MRILIVDDTIVLRKSIRWTLEDAGHEEGAAAGAERALLYAEGYLLVAELGDVRGEVYLQVRVRVKGGVDAYGVDYLPGIVDLLLYLL